MAGITAAGISFRYSIEFYPISNRNFSNKINTTQHKVVTKKTNRKNKNKTKKQNLVVRAYIIVYMAWKNRNANASDSIRLVYVG